MGLNMASTYPSIRDANPHRTVSQFPAAVLTHNTGAGTGAQEEIISKFYFQ